MRKEAFIFIMWGTAFWAFALPVLFWKMGKMDVLINILDWFSSVVAPYFLIASFIFTGAICFFMAILTLKAEKEIRKYELKYKKAYKEINNEQS